MSRYFQGLNYSLANEDTWIEYELLPQNVSSVFSVCGSGSRVLPLLARNPGELHVVDLSLVQLALCRLRVAAAKKLTREEFLFLMGYTSKAKAGKSRANLLAELKLDEEDFKLWKKQESSWKDKGFIYLGKWERHFMKLGGLFQKIPGINLRPLFETENFEEQKALLEKYWHPRLFQLYTHIVLNEWISNKLLYKGSYAGSKKARTHELSAAEMVYREFHDLFQTTWVRSNFFLNLIFLNEVSYPEAYPAECSEEVLEAIKHSRTEVFYQQENLLSLLKERPHAFYSLSDTFSYMQESEVGNFLNELPQKIPNGSQMVIRTFMRKPHFHISAPWHTKADLNSALARRDCTRVYEFTVLQKI